MDNNKNALIVGILAVLLLPMCLGGAFITDSQGRWVDLNYAEYGFVSMGADLTNSSPQYVSLASFIPIRDKQVYVRLTSKSYYGDPDALLQYRCYPYGNYTYNYVNLSEYSATWESEGFAFIPISLSFVPSTNNSNISIYAFYCQFALLYGNATMQIYASPKTTPDKTFPIPNADLANLIGTRTVDVNGTTHITGVRGIISAGFDIIDLMLMLMAMFLFVFFLIFAYIMFEFFVSLLKVKEENG